MQSWARSTEDACKALLRHQGQKDLCEKGSLWYSSKPLRIHFGISLPHLWTNCDSLGYERIGMMPGMMGILMDFERALSKKRE